jgi:hypothetical protein
MTMNMANNDICVVFLCNKAYFDKFIYTCNQLVTNGKYNGNICLVIGDDLQGNPLLECDTIKNNNVIIKYFPNFAFSSRFITLQKSLQRPPHWFHKLFQYHKFHLFNTFFKKWKTILYLDCGITIYSDVSLIINERTENALVAHSDGYPTYQWKLSGQFDHTKPEYFTKLKQKFNLNIDHYFQTTVMLYDTSIITNDTYNNLLALLSEYPICITNDQGIIALYFTLIRPVFKQLKIKNDDTYFYDYLSRNNSYKYIMLKMGYRCDDSI